MLAFNLSVSAGQSDWGPGKTHKFTQNASSLQFSRAREANGIDSTGAVEGEALKTSFECLRAKVPIRMKDMSRCNAEVFTSALHQVLQAAEI